MLIEWLWKFWGVEAILFSSLCKYEEKLFYS